MEGRSLSGVKLGSTHLVLQAVKRTRTVWLGHYFQIISKHTHTHTSKQLVVRCFDSVSRNSMSSGALINIIQFLRTCMDCDVTKIYIICPLVCLVINLCPPLQLFSKTNSFRLLCFNVNSLLPKMDPMKPLGNNRCRIWWWGGRHKRKRFLTNWLQLTVAIFRDMTSHFF